MKSKILFSEIAGHHITKSRKINCTKYENIVGNMFNYEANGCERDLKVVNNLLTEITGH